MSKKAKQQDLTDQQLSEIADRVSARMQEKPAGAGNPTQKQKTSGKGMYFWGAASGIALALAAPALRPAVRGAVKGGILAGRYAKRVGSNLKEELEDIAAEAQAELDTEKNSESHDSHPGV
jgi:hypothetical protein